MDSYPDLVPAAPSPPGRADTRPPQCGNVQRRPEPHSGQKGDVGNSAFRQSCAPMRNQARTLNPLAPRCFIWPDTNSLVRQYSAALRTAHTGSVSLVLTAPIARAAELRVVRSAQSPPRHSTTGVAAPNCRPPMDPRQGGVGGVSPILHSCEHLRSHALRLNSLAPGVPV